MCVLRVYSENDSFKEFAGKTIMPVYVCFDKGEERGKRIISCFDIRFTVSEKEWDDFNGQVEDAILYLKKYKYEFSKLQKKHDISNAYLDFPLWSKLNKKIVGQFEYIPKELITLAGELNIGIEISIYSKYKRIKYRHKNSY